MADRLNQYPMLPSNFTPAMLPQHHPQQGQQQSQGDSHTPLQGILNPEHNRMWQAMQQIQREQQYRSQNGGDVPGVQNNQQVADLIRSQNIARVQGQQQMGQQQQFGLSSSQMNTPGQHPGYHDQHGPQQSNSQMSAGFGSNMGIPNATQLQANFNTRNAMLHAFNQPISRQLDMMGLQNQQHQNAQGGPANFAARMAQQQSGMNGQSQQSQQGQPTIFSSPAMQASDVNRASPPRPSSQTPGSMNQQGSMQANGQGMPPGRRQMTFLELRERASQIQAYIVKQEAAAMALNNNRASVEQGSFMAQMQALAADVRGKKELLAKLGQAMNQATSNGNGPQGGNPRNLQGSPGPGQQHQQPGPSGQNQPGWIGQQGSTSSQGVSPMAHGGPPLPARPAQNIQASLQASPQHHPPGQWQQNNLGPQRPGSTQHMPGQITNQISPSMSNQFPSNQLPTQSGQNTSQIPLPPPLDKSKFEESYAAFRRSRPIKQDERLMRVDNRPIDLHALHYNVLSEGGIKKVTAREMWPIIGARMGFVQFPASDTEPAKAGPGVAQQLQHLYTECLATFDNIYVASVFQKKGFFPPQAGASGLQGNHTAANSPQINNNPPPTQGNNGSPGNNMPGASQVNMMNAVMVYANVPAAELRTRGVPEQVVHFVENNRAHLQRTMQQQQMFRGMIPKPNIPGQASEPGRNNPDAIGTFSGMLPSQQQGSMPPAGLRPPPPAHPAGMTVNGTSNGQLQPPQKPPPTNGMAAISPSYPRPTQEQSQEAILYIQRTKHDFVTHNLPNMKQYAVPESQKEEYNRTLEQAFRHAQELEPKLPLYFYVLKDPEMIRKLIAIIYTTRQQRTLVADGAPKYILSLSTLSTLIQQIQQANAQFNAVANYSRPSNDATVNGQQGSNGLGQRGPIPPQGPPQSSHQTPQQQPQQPQRIQTTPSLPAQSIPPPAGNRPVHLNPPPPPKKKAHQPALSAVASATTSTPTPPASTPAASAATPATPAAASPKTPKSPKSKAASKPKPTAQSKRKSSRIIPPTPEPVQPNAPSPSGSLKRQREEEEPIVSTPAVSNAPSPKKAKTEWEGEASEALVKKEQEMENIKTEEDASAFLERMTELIRLAAGNDGQESLTSDISETLDMILKGCGQDTSDPGAMAPLGMGDVAGPPSSLLPAADEFQFKDFLDFTSCAADEDYSKPATPDLVASSSTNPSPESASDPADAAGQAATTHTADATKLANFKVEDSYDLDLRLGVWKEIDGGESSYYQSDKWIWEGPMPALDQPWAFTS